MRHKSWTVGGAFACVLAAEPKVLLLDEPS